jgi:choline dehydrogenase-like flavoprotein
MIVDTNDLEDLSVLTADVCIIGSGAAGITLAREFIGHPHSVVVLEAGGAQFELPSQDPYQSEILGLPSGGIHDGRVRVLGGTTTRWAGQTLPLFDIDFEQRDWVPYSGWPIDRAALEPYYRRAADAVQVPYSTNDTRSWPVSEPPKFAPDTLVHYYSQYTSVPSFAQKYREAISAAPNIRLLLHANVTSLEPNESASALREVRARSLSGRSVTVRAAHFVICAGGIESARLLLISDSVEKTGIGNAHDVVGRYFQDHPGVSLPITPIDADAFHAAYDSVHRQGIRYSFKIASSAGLQRSQRILHTVAEVYYPEDINGPVRAAKDLVTAVRDKSRLHEVPSLLGRIARNPGGLLSAIYQFYVRKKAPSVLGTAPLLGLSCEQQPNPLSRVTLSHQIDVLGIRRSALDWRMSGAEQVSMEALAVAIATEWKRLGLAHLDPAQLQFDRLVDANHHIGTTRMGLDLATSVVDPSCRVHGYRNLFIGSSSVFPTGGSSNPTLTTLALCLRIADDIKQQSNTLLA